MANSIEVLPDAELASIVGASNLDTMMRERTGMCGCGVLPGGGAHSH